MVGCKVEGAADSGEEEEEEEWGSFAGGCGSGCGGCTLDNEELSLTSNG